MSIKTKETGFGIWKIFVGIGAVIVISCAVIFGVILADSTGVNIKKDVRVVVESGDGPAAVARKLKAAGAIKYPKAFRIVSRFGGYDSKYMPGAVTVKNGASYEDILDQLCNVERDTVKIVIPEGYEAKQIAQEVAAATDVTEEEFMAALDPSLYDYKFLENLPERSIKMEGYLFPATYTIPLSYSAQDIVSSMLDAFNQRFSEEYYARAAELNMSVDDVITMASVVERETGSGAERGKVAGVFYNRIKAGMKLQSCATVQYVLGERKPVLTIADTKTDSPYNTYVHAGLPVGPICNPGEESIRAALYPEETDAYYFCLSKNGEHIFSTNYNDHKKAMESNDLVIGVDTSAIENEDAKK